MTERNAGLRLSRDDRSEIRDVSSALSLDALHGDIEDLKQKVDAVLVALVRTPRPCTTRHRDNPGMHRLSRNAAAAQDGPYASVAPVLPRQGRGRRLPAQIGAVRGNLQIPFAPD